MARRAWSAFALALVLLVPACRRSTSDTGAPASEPAAADTTTPVPGTATLSGQVFYLPRIALPPDAELTVTLQDVTKADAPAIEIASTIVKTEGRQVPIPFTLAYEPAKVDESHAYSVAARIQSGGQLLWSSDPHAPVLTRGAPTDSVSIKVSPVPK
jgi:putative lipoprotein